MRRLEVTDAFSDRLTVDCVGEKQEALLLELHCEDDPDFLLDRLSAARLRDCLNEFLATQEKNTP